MPRVASSRLNTISFSRRATLGIARSCGFRHNPLTPQCPRWPIERNAQSAKQVLQALYAALGIGGIAIDGHFLVDIQTELHFDAGSPSLSYLSAPAERHHATGDEEASPQDFRPSQMCSDRPPFDSRTTGGAACLGRRCRRFESCHPDH
jgi:hypothetical protein